MYSKFNLSVCNFIYVGFMCHKFIISDSFFLNYYIKCRVLGMIESFCWIIWLILKFITLCFYQNLFSTKCHMLQSFKSLLEFIFRDLLIFYFNFRCNLFFYRNINHKISSVSIFLYFFIGGRNCLHFFFHLRITYF